MAGQEIYTTIERLRENINHVFIGKEAVVEDLLVCLLAGGHVLLEDVPGVGKTTLAGVLARATSCSFGRIQFTPDTLPGDVSGVSIYNMKSGEFEYRAGAVMSQILLADEINRTSPKTQASLLEAMAEGQVTVDGVIHELPRPFMVIATQNPVEFLGTYPLPEAQMDRFMMRLSIGYPEREQEIRMAEAFLQGETPDRVQTVCSAAEVMEMKEAAASVSVSSALLAYMEDIVDLTRQEERFVLGASPRALLSLMRASQSRALVLGRDFVKPDDVKAVAMQVLLHRLVLATDAKLRKENAENILKSLILKAKIPV
ncbi:MAG: MoxR family ATPase [Lachnospiraceae bacterium]